MRAERSLCAGERGELAACGPAAEHGVERGLRAAGHAVVRRTLAAARKVSRVRVFHVKHSGPHERWDAREAMGVRAMGALAAVALSLACVLPGTTAWAAEGDGAPGPNEVNPQQMPDRDRKSVV